MKAGAGHTGQRVAALTGEGCKGTGAKRSGAPPAECPGGAGFLGKRCPCVVLQPSRRRETALGTEAVWPVSPHFHQCINGGGEMQTPAGRPPTRGSPLAVSVASLRERQVDPREPSKYSCHYPFCLLFIRSSNKHSPVPLCTNPGPRNTKVTQTWHEPAWSRDRPSIDGQ